MIEKVCTTRRFSFCVNSFQICFSAYRNAKISVSIPHDIAARTANQFERYRDGLETLVLGDSHSKWGIHPDTLGNAFVAALPGQSYLESSHLLRSYVEGGLASPRVVVAGLDLHSFGTWVRNEWGFLHFYAPHVDYLEEGRRRGRLPFYALRQFQGLYAPYVSERRNILSYLQTGHRRLGANGRKSASAVC